MVIILAIFGDVARSLRPLRTVCLNAHLVTDHSSPISCEKVDFDLSVVGAGELGSRIVKQYAKRHPNARILVEALSDSKRSEFEQLNLNLEFQSMKTEKSFRPKLAQNVVICFPPGQSSDFPADVAHACARWAGDPSKGKLVYTSSIGKSSLTIIESSSSCCDI